MFSFKLFFALTLLACAVAEPAQRRLHFRTSARQEAAESDQAQSDGPYPPAGWKPQGERLVLPARQQTQEGEFTGYNYPKPDQGLPDEPTTTAETETEEPQTEEITTETAEGEETTTSATNEETTEQSTDISTETDATTVAPQPEALKIIPQRLQQLIKSQRVQLEPIQQLQPVFYVQYPNGVIQQPQIFYVLE